MTESGAGNFLSVGQNLPRQGLKERITGQTRFTADLKRPGMLHGRILRSPHPHARIVAIDTAAAASFPGVRAVLTYKDVPPGRLAPDLAVLEETLRFVGDEVALVAAESEAQAEDALAAISVRYAILPAVFEPEQALAPGAPPLHPGGNLAGGAQLQVERGQVEDGFSQAAQVFEGHFETQGYAPVGMEPRAALAEWREDTLTVWKTSRGVHAVDRPALASVFGLAPEAVRVICTAMGGGFGNKDESRLAALTTMLARHTGRPVRMEYSREEEFVAGRNRQASRIQLKVGVARDGQPLAVEMETLLNGGAYIASGLMVARRVGQGALYLYQCPHARFTAKTVYTNRPAGGSFRGLGAPLGHFALEVLMDQVAHNLGIDPLQYRLRFGVPLAGQPGRRTTPADSNLPDEPVEGGVPFSSNGLRACLEAGAERIGWQTRRKPNGAAVADGAERCRGLGVAMGLYKGGVGREAEAEITILPSGEIDLNTGAVDVGQGSDTVLRQMVAEVLQVEARQVTLRPADTAQTLPTHITAGSSTTVSTGSAVQLAAQQALNRLLEAAAAAMNTDAAVLRGGRLVDCRDEGRGLSLAEVAAKHGRNITGHARHTAGSREFLIGAFCAHFAEVEVDRGTGRIRLLRYVAAHDSGRIINPRLAEGQVSGGVLQFLGAALREELLLDPRSGVTLNPGFLEHKSTAIVDFPPAEVLFPAEPDPLTPFGAKGLGEPPVVPVFAAISNAVANATGVWLHEVPFSPERVLRALEQGAAK